jgi:hypothetical protein
MPVAHGRSHILAPPHVSGATPQHWGSSFVHPRTRTEIKLAAAVAVALTALVVGGLLYSGVYLDLQSSPEGKGANLVLATRPIGRILVPTDGPFCREHTFDNGTGRIGGYRLVRCDEPPTADSKPAFASGFNSFKDAFGKR